MSKFQRKKFIFHLHLFVIPKVYQFPLDIFKSPLNIFHYPHSPFLAHIPINFNYHANPQRFHTIEDSHIPFSIFLAVMES